MLLILLGVTACKVVGAPTPYVEDNCSADNAIRYDGDVVFNDMKLNEYREHYFDLGSL